MYRFAVLLALSLSLTCFYSCTTLPNPLRVSEVNPPAADGSKVIIIDTDHLWGLGGNRQWVWKSFLRGLNPIYMDTYRQTVLGIAYEARDTDSESIRRNMGYTNIFAQKMDLINMLPSGELSSSGYCLAKAGHEYIAFADEGIEIVLDLSSADGEFGVEWLNPETGEYFPANSVDGGEAVTLIAPFEGTDAVVYLKRLSSTSEN